MDELTTLARAFAGESLDCPPADVFRVAAVLRDALRQLDDTGAGPLRQERLRAALRTLLPHLTP
jgi:hypothetical protein